jgi:hypothetical protein
MWNCPKCGEEIEDQFDSCWKCAAVPEQLDDSKAGPAMMTGCAIGVLFMAALILAVLFAVGGAGIYGSPFDPGRRSHKYAVLYAATILVGPLASLVALVFHKRLPYLSGVSLVLGAAAGVFIGLVVESDFRYFWGKVFVIVVWLPMSVVGARILLRKPQP